MPMQSPTDLFTHELSGIYAAEQTIVQMLPTLSSEAKNPQLMSALQEHERDTKHQIQNLDQVFRQIGSMPRQVQCFPVEGFKREHEEFKKERPSEQVLTAFITGAAAKTEHYEIASYRGLVEMARFMGQQEVARLLQENLQQEERMALRVEQIGQQLGQQMMQPGMSGYPGEQESQRPPM